MVSPTTAPTTEGEGRVPPPKKAPINHQVVATTTTVQQQQQQLVARNNSSGLIQHNRSGPRISNLISPQSRIRLALTVIIAVNCISIREPSSPPPPPTISSGENDVPIRGGSKPSYSYPQQQQHILVSPFPLLFSLVAPGSAQITAAPDTSTGITDTDPVLYITDDLILLNPVEGTTLFMFVIILGAAAEVIFEKLKNIKDHAFHTVFGSIVEEAMLCGIMSMVLIFVTSLGKLSTSWLGMIHNSVLTLLAMAVYFALLAFGVLRLVKNMTDKFRNFEKSRMGVDPLLSVREQIYKESEEYFRATVTYHNLRVEGVNEVLYADYLHRRSAFVIAEVFDLSWKTWLVLAVFVIVNGVRTRITLGDEAVKSDSSLIAHYSTYIVVIGFLPMAIYTGLHVTLRMRLSKVISKPVVDPNRRRDPRHNVTEEATPSRYLFFGDLGITTSVFQSIVLMIEWYLAYFTLNMIGTGFNQLGPLTGLFIVLAIGPVVLFALLFPWTVLIVTMLENLGTDLKEDLVIELADALIAEQHGITAVAPRGGGGGGDATVTAPRKNANTKRPLPKMATAAYQRRQQTVLGIDDEWNDDHPLLLCEDAAATSARVAKQKKREHSDESGSSSLDTKSSDSDDKSPSDGDSDNSDIKAARRGGGRTAIVPIPENVSAAILDKNYLRDKQKERDRNYAKEQKERKAKFEQEAAQKANNRGMQPTNGGDILKPMYVPDWRFNPILARQSEMDLQRSRYVEEQRNQQELEEILTAQMSNDPAHMMMGGGLGSPSRFNKRGSSTTNNDKPFEL